MGKLPTERQGEIATSIRGMTFILVPICMAAWVSERKVVTDRQSIRGGISIIGKELPLIYTITVDGSDDAEDFVVDEIE